VGYGHNDSHIPIFEPTLRSSLWELFELKMGFYIDRSRTCNSLSFLLVISCLTAVLRFTLSVQEKCPYSSKSAFTPECVSCDIGLVREDAKEIFRMILTARPGHSFHVAEEMGRSIFTCADLVDPMLYLHRTGARSMSARSIKGCVPSSSCVVLVLPGLRAYLPRYLT